MLVKFDAPVQPELRHSEMFLVNVLDAYKEHQSLRVAKTVRSRENERPGLRGRSRRHSAGFSLRDCLIKSMAVQKWRGELRRALDCGGVAGAWPSKSRVPAGLLDSLLDWAASSSSSTRIALIKLSSHFVKWLDG